MDMRRHREILAAGHQGYALDRVVDRDREMVARRELLAGEHDIAEQGRVRWLPEFALDQRPAGQSARARGRGRAATHSQFPSAALWPPPRRLTYGRPR